MTHFIDAINPISMQTYCNNLNEITFSFFIQDENIMQSMHMFDNVI